VVGDIHGHFYDMIHMFDLYLDHPAFEHTETSKKKNTKRSFEDYDILFLGDYIDRGIKDVEVLLFLYCLMICHPKQVVMLRGNHEDEYVTEN